MAIQAIWFNGTKKEDREKVIQDIGLAFNAFRRLEEIIKLKMRDTSPVSDYDKASWPFFRADRDGYERALTEVLQLLKEPD